MTFNSSQRALMNKSQSCNTVHFESASATGLSWKKAPELWMVKCLCVGAWRGFGYPLAPFRRIKFMIAWILCFMLICLIDDSCGPSVYQDCLCYCACKVWYNSILELGTCVKVMQWMCVRFAHKSVYAVYCCCFCGVHNLIQCVIAVCIHCRWS